MSEGWRDWRRHVPSGRTELFGILGSPLEHSLSPSLHTAVLRSLGVDAVYVPFPVGEKDIASFLDLAPSLGVVGLNVTTPLKEIVARHIRPLDRETQRSEMVNTVLFRKGEASGCGTDGNGILSWIRRYVPSAARIGVLGFGPTARSFLHRQWWDEGARGSVLVSRSPQSARERLAQWPSLGRGAGRLAGPSPQVSAWHEIPDSVDVWVSTLPPGTRVPESFWAKAAGSVILDMNYGAGRSTIADEAKRRGNLAADGLGPLLEQAALSLSIWLGEDVDVAVFRKAAAVTKRAVAPTRSRGSTG